MHIRHFKGRVKAFTRVELAATSASALLILILVVAAAPRSRESGQRAVCANNLKRLGAAIQSYSGEHEGLLPPWNSSDRWHARLQPYYRDSEVLKCPSDPIGLVPRSYLFNGFVDYWRETVPFYLLATNELGMPEAAIPKPSETVSFGEKTTGSIKNHVFIFNQ